MHGHIVCITYTSLPPYPSRSAYINFTSLYIVWLCGALAYHLPSLEAFGIDVRADLSLTIVVFIATLVVRARARLLVRAGCSACGACACVLATRACWLFSLVTAAVRWGMRAHARVKIGACRILISDAVKLWTDACAQVLSTLWALHAACVRAGLLKRKISAPRGARLRQVMSVLLLNSAACALTCRCVWGGYVCVYACVCVLGGVWSGVYPAILSPPVPHLQVCTLP